MTIKGSISRRRALAGAATAGIGVPLLAACGDDGGSASDTNDPTTSASSSATGKPPKTDQSGATEQTSAPPAGDGIPTSDVPVGSGIVLTDPRVVITQPTEGDFKAFTSICTHAGCPVARVTTEIECDCHGSRYSIEDGSVLGGPAPSPLPAVDFTVTGDQIAVE